MTLADLDNWRELLQTIQGAVELIQSLYPVEDELVVPTSTLEHLHAVVNGQADISDIKDDSLSLRLRVEVDPDHVVEVRIAFSLRPSVDDAAPSSIPTLTLLQPAWLSNSPFHVLAEQLEADTNPVEEEPTALLLDFVARLQKLALTFLPANSVASTGSSFEGSIDDLSHSTDGLSLQDSMSNLLCVSKMHHIRSMSKFRKLKSFALTHGASGFAKAGRPGILLYEVESKDALVKFLATVRSLKYLDFHHLASTPLPPLPSSTSTKHPCKNPTSDPSPNVRLNAGTPGLEEVAEMKDLLLAAESVGHREWFREAVGMTGRG